MLTILPEDNPKLIASYNPKTENAALLVSKSGGREVGHIVVEQRDDCLFIIGFSIRGFDLSQKADPAHYADADAILRAAGSYALNRNLYLVCCEKEEYYPLLKQFDFKEFDNYLSINLTQLFKLRKNCF